MKLLQMLFFVAVVTLSAQESDVGAECDVKHETCMEKCDQLENPTSECYSGCDESYNTCLDALGVFNESASSEDIYEDSEKE